MFDNQSPNQPLADLPQTGQPTVSPKPGRETPGTEDIFSDTEPLASKSLLGGLREAAVTPTVNPLPPLSARLPEPLTELPDDLEEEEGGSRKFFWLGLVAVVVILALGGWYIYAKFFATSGLNLPAVNINSLSPTELNKQFENKISNFNLNAQNGEANPEIIPTSTETAATSSPINPPEAIDSDLDGLTDAEESDLGTNFLEPDSDNDGLFDREEVKVYETDPLTTDTDGDGYLDGQEVKGGYNPKGPGKLLELNF